MSRVVRMFLVVALVALLLVGAVGCIAGTERYEEKKATFWSGLFHGIISPVTLFISLFTGAIDMYEPNNVGWGYDVGFYLGVVGILGGGAGGRKTVWRLGKSKTARREWESLGEEIVREVRDGLRGRSEGTEDDEASWREIARKIEEKVKRKLKKWADKD